MDKFSFDTIGLIVQLKIKNYHHSILAESQESFISFGTTADFTRLAPDGPCHRIQQRRFSMAIFTRQTDQFIMTEIDGLWFVTITEKIFNVKFARNHKKYLRAEGQD